MISRIFVVADIEAKSDEDARFAAAHAIQMIRQGMLVRNGAFGLAPAPEIRAVTICGFFGLLRALFVRKASPD